jgi:hypothetical protein
LFLFIIKKGTPYWGKIKNKNKEKDNKNSPKTSSTT